MTANRYYVGDLKIEWYVRFAEQSVISHVMQDFTHKMTRMSGLTPEARGTISALWKIRHDSPMNRRMLRAAISSEQKWRRMFMRLPRQTGK